MKDQYSNAGSYMGAWLWKSIYRILGTNPVYGYL